MGGFIFGEVTSREQSPWAYDSVNDLPKSHSLYPVAMGLSGKLIYATTNIAGGGFVDLATIGGAFNLVPAGKQLFLTDVFLSAQNGKVQATITINGTGIAVVAIANDGGGNVHIALVTPVLVAAGETISAQLYNANLTTASDEVTFRANYLQL